MFFENLCVPCIIRTALNASKIVFPKLQFLHENNFNLVVLKKIVFWYFLHVELLYFFCISFVFFLSIEL